MKNPTLWLFASLAWFGTLWLLSSSTQLDVPMPPLRFVDKYQHFGYFFGGAILFSAYLFFRRPEAPRWRVLIPTVILTMALVGGLDEFHQSFVPGRSGNDMADWLADFCGAIAGAFAFKAGHRWLR